MVAIFLVHVLVNVKVTLSGRFPRRNVAVNSILVIAGALVLAATICMERA